MLSASEVSPPGFEPVTYRSIRWYAIHSAVASQQCYEFHVPIKLLMSSQQYDY